MVDSFVNSSKPVVVVGVTHTTAKANTSSPPPVNVNPKVELAIGVALSVIGNLFISVGMNIQKYSHNNLKSGKSYLRSSIWWFGMVVMILGEVGNFGAYSFGPASFVAPLGSTCVIANAVIAVTFLNEKLRSTDIMGITWALIGAYLLFTFSSNNGQILSASAVISNVKQHPFIIYLLIEVLAFIAIFYVRWRHEYISVVTFLLPGAILASFTVISAKAVSSMLILSLDGRNQMDEPIFYVMLVVMALSGVGQVRYLNQAIAVFDISVVMPTNFILFSISAMLSGIIFFREFSRLGFITVCMILLGVLLSFLGVFLLTGTHKKGEFDDTLEELSTDDEQPSLIVGNVKRQNNLFFTYLLGNSNHNEEESTAKNEQIY